MHPVQSPVSGKLYKWCCEVPQRAPDSRRLARPAGFGPLVPLRERSEKVEEAIEYLQNKKADLIVLDMIMDPGIDGTETYQRILKINPVQKAIIVSGFSETDRVRKAQEMGAGAFVQKPYVLEKIGIAIRKELDRKWARTFLPVQMFHGDQAKCTREDIMYRIKYLGQA
jgi:DNA-binding NtrC family response regulator